MDTLRQYQQESVQVHKVPASKVNSIGTLWIAGVVISRGKGREEADNLRFLGLFSPGFSAVIKITQKILTLFSQQAKGTPRINYGISLRQP